MAPGAIYVRHVHGMKQLTSIAASGLTCLAIAAEIDFIWDNVGHWPGNSLGVIVSTVLCQIVLLLVYFRIPHLVAGIVRASGGTIFDTLPARRLQLMLGGLITPLNFFIMYIVLRLKDALAMK